MTIWLVIVIQGMSSPGLTGPDRLARLPVTPHVDSYVDLSGASGNTIVDLKSEAEALIVLRMGRANRHELLTSRSLNRGGLLTFFFFLRSIIIIDIY
jgi:hypothetical protein